MYVSMALLSGCPSSNVGFLSLILVLKSPHIIVVSCGYILSNKSSIYSVANVSAMFRFASDAMGGRYILTTLILWLLGNVIFASIPYSFPLV